jgi:hypothetical protein
MNDHFIEGVGPRHGAEVLSCPASNRDVAFTDKERDTLGLRGLLPVAGGHHRGAGAAPWGPWASAGSPLTAYDARSRNRTRPPVRRTAVR